MNRRLLAVLGLAIAALGLILGVDLFRDEGERRTESASLNSPTGSEEGAAEPANQRPFDSADTVSGKAVRTASIIANFEPPQIKVKILDPLPEEDGTWGEIYTRLAPAAEAGDSEAQFRLYRVAYDCYKGPRTQSQLEKFATNAATPLTDNQGNVLIEVNADHHVADFVRTYERCRDAPIKELLHYVEWLEAAAESGYVRAMVSYGATEFPGDDDLDMTDPEVEAAVRERQRRSLRYLEEAKAQGSIDAIGQLAYQYGVPSDPQRSPDPVKSLAHWYATAWFRFESEGSDRLMRNVDKLAKKMRASQFQEAIEQGKQIMRGEKCCFKIPENDS